MKKRLLLSLGLLAVIAVAATILVLGESASTLADSNKLSEIQPSALSRILIQRDNAEEIIVKRKEARWMLVSPLVARANPDRVESILGLARTTSHARLARGDIPLSSYGLDPAPVKLQLDQHSFYFGNTDPIDERRYLLFRENIHLIDDGLFHQLRQKA